MHAGDQLPTLKEVVEALAIPNAVVKACGELEHEGLVVRRQGVGTFIASTPPARPLVADVLEIGRCLNPGFDTSWQADGSDSLDIPTHARISTLSGGQRAQVALTPALAKQPDLMPLDEPLANLDPLALASSSPPCSPLARTPIPPRCSPLHVVAELNGSATPSSCRAPGGYAWPVTSLSCARPIGSLRGRPAGQPPVAER
jgi:hypothetical protein